MFGRETRMLLRHYLEQGASKSALARQLGISRDTVHRWIRAGDLDRDLDDTSVRYGPRPPVPEEVVHYEISERRRLSMRPGITCIWQVSGRNEIGFHEWVKLDLQYIDSWSLTLDARILARTVPAVVFARGAH